MPVFWVTITVARVDPGLGFIGSPESAQAPGRAGLCRGSPEPARDLSHEQVTVAAARVSTDFFSGRLSQPVRPTSSVSLSADSGHASPGLVPSRSRPIRPAGRPQACLASGSRVARVSAGLVTSHGSPESARPAAARALSRTVSPESARALSVTNLGSWSPRVSLGLKLRLVAGPCRPNQPRPSESVSARAAVSRVA